MFRDAQEELQRLEKELLATESENTDDPQDFDDFSIQPPSKTAMYIPDWQEYPEEIREEEADEEEDSAEEEETAESHQSSILLIAIIFILFSAIVVTVAAILLRMGGRL